MAFILLLGFGWEFREEKKRKENISKERKEKKRKEAYFFPLVWEFRERKENNFFPSWLEARRNGRKENIMTFFYYYTLKQIEVK